MRSFPDSFKFFCFSDDPLSKQLYDNIFKKHNIDVTTLSTYHDFICKEKIPVIIDIIFREYCPACKKLMPQGKPPIKCYCGEEVRLGYIPIFELPKTNYGFIIGPYELPSKAVKALRKKGWRVAKIREDQQILELIDFIKNYVMRNEENVGKKTFIGEDSKKTS